MGGVEEGGGQDTACFMWLKMQIACEHGEVKVTVWASDLSGDGAVPEAVKVCVVGCENDPCFNDGGVP